jgi:hypothetical protein
MGVVLGTHAVVVSPPVLPPDCRNTLRLRALTDLHLADMSGRDMALILGQYRPQLPIGFTTDLEDVEPSATTLPLPFTAPELEGFVDRLLQHRRLIASAAALLARAAEAVQQSRRLTDAVWAGRHARWAILAQTGQLRAAARELRALR